LNEEIAMRATNIKILDPPVPPKKPVMPNIELNLAVSGIIGFSLAVWAFFAWRPMWDAKQALQVMNLPVLDWIERMPGKDRVRGATLPMDRLRLGVQPWLSGQSKCIVVTSAERGDGKTIVAASLANSFAHSGARVLLIDTNLLNPGIHEVFGVSPAPGLSDYIASKEAEVLPRIVRISSPMLHIVPAGGNSRANLVSSPAVRELINLHQSDHDVIIIDTPALTDSLESLSLL
jgi:Mrp family chromosome partitioning ATPase